MAAVASVELDIVGVGGVRGALSIHLLPGSKSAGGPPPLVDTADDPTCDPGQEPVQLLEGKEYRYVISLQAPWRGPLSTDHPELFIPDDEGGTRGRLRTGLFVGSIRSMILCDGVCAGHVVFEVRSTKLDYLYSYRWMLRDIADTAGEIIMDRFAPSGQSFVVDDVRDADTLYQRFAFLRGLIECELFQASIRHIITQPCVAWEEIEEWRPAGLGARSSGALIRRIEAGGVRVPWPSAPEGSSLTTLPEMIAAPQTEITLDNVPNRFVKFALERWRSVIADIGAALREERSSAPVERGCREVDAVLERIDAILGEELFREVGYLSGFPTGNQVLQKRDGYRYILSAYAQFELSASLSWPGMEDAYSAGQRNVAKLYDYWVYLQLGQMIAQVCSGEFDFASLIEARDDGMILQLRTGERQVLEGSVVRLGRRLRLQLWFNRTFGASSGRAGSWTRPLRPDCSLLVEPEAGAASFEPVWIHFDAKYRVDTILELFGEKPLTNREEELYVQRQSFRGEDLLKMHAYKDAIQRSVGAYIVYPGSDDEQPFREYHELLPGLGAFALRPTDSGDPAGLQAITTFINDVVDHVAMQASQHERARYWLGQIYSAGLPVGARVPAAPFLEQPPADTLVLLGYVKSAAHHKWIMSKMFYNLRADGERNGSLGVASHELGARFVILYGEDELERVHIFRIVGAPCVMTAEQLVRDGYPEPLGMYYFCLPIEALHEEDESAWLDGALVRRLRVRVTPAARWGAPFAVTWLDLCSEF